MTIRIHHHRYRQLLQFFDHPWTRATSDFLYITITHLAVASQVYPLFPQKLPGNWGFSHYPLTMHSAFTRTSVRVSHSTNHCDAQNRAQDYQFGIRSICVTKHGVLVVIWPAIYLWVLPLWPRVPSIYYKSCWFFLIFVPHSPWASQLREIMSIPSSPDSGFSEPDFFSTPSTTPSSPVPPEFTHFLIPSQVDAQFLRSLPLQAGSEDTVLLLRYTGNAADVLPLLNRVQVLLGIPVFGNGLWQLQKSQG